MKKAIFAVLAAFSIATCFAACKTNTNNLPDNTVTAPSTSQIPNVDNNERATRLPYNGEVTDGNGIIGDSDDLIIDRDGTTYNNRTDNTNKVGDTINNAAKNAGDTINNAAHNIGDVVDNIADKAGDTVQNAADNIGDTVEHATNNNNNR